MLLHKKHKRAASYPLLTVLILQFTLSSLVCAAAGYAADSMTLCTSLGLKTVTIDANGNPVEDNSQHAGFESHCFHCATGCNTGAIITPVALAPFRAHHQLSYIRPKQTLHGQHLTRGPPPRAPPHTV